MTPGQMTSDQLFILEILKVLASVFLPIIAIVGGVIAFNQQNKKLDAATAASKKAEAAANHSKEVTASMQQNFKAVIQAIAPDAAKAMADSPNPLISPTGIPPGIPVVVVNPEPLPVTETATEPKGV